MTRGHDGSLLLSCETLSFSAPRRFIPAPQWVLTFPAPLRYLLAYDTELCTKTLGLFVDQVIAHYRFVLAREHSVDAGSLFGGSVTSIQRAGSALQATLHFHTVALDGVYLVTDDEPPRFLAAPRPSPAEIQAVARGIVSGCDGDAAAAWRRALRDGRRPRCSRAGASVVGAELGGVTAGGRRSR